MASVEGSVNNLLFSSSLQEDEFDHDADADADVDPDDQQHHTQSNLSRLSMCSSSLYNVDEDDDDAMKMFMSRLSIESFDADEELSDGKDLSSDSDKEPGCYSLPATPPRRSKRLLGQQVMGLKEYASENELQKARSRQRGIRRKNLRRRRRITGEGNRGESRIKGEIKREEEKNYHSFSGESEGSGFMVITRPKGGCRSLCMDLEEVKACRDLGFELEHERMFEMPTRISVSGSTPLDTASSGGNSPIANWRISSPG